MLTDQEKGFLQWWEENRLRKKKIRRQLSVGLPLGAVLGGAILLNVYSGWNKAGTVLRYNGELLLVLLLAILLIVVFIVIFSAKHRWDMHEQHYRELLAKKDKP